MKLKKNKEIVGQVDVWGLCEEQNHHCTTQWTAKHCRCVEMKQIVVVWSCGMAVSG